MGLAANGRESFSERRLSKLDSLSAPLSQRGKLRTSAEHISTTSHSVFNLPSINSCIPAILIDT